MVTEDLNTVCLHAGISVHVVIGKNFDPRLEMERFPRKQVYPLAAV
jgi:hypothetical protein